MKERDCVREKGVSVCEGKCVCERERELVCVCVLERVSERKCVCV